jgi:hypothetical protein
MRRTPGLCCLALLVALAGCSAGYQGGGESIKSDRLGWEDGYRANDSLSVTTADGLNESELSAVVARTMARVEEIRGLEFRESVPVEVITREEYRERSVSFSTGGETRDTLYEALLLVGEDREAGAVLDELFGSSVVGYYSSSEDRIVVVSDSETPTLDRSTLAHELVHALQDQHFSRVDSRTFDGRLAGQGLTEGDPSVVAREYERRCEQGWSCLDRPTRDRPPAGPVARNPGVYLTVIQPYRSGPAFVEALRERGGWAAVNGAYAAPPNSTEQVIHPDRYPEDRPVDVAVPDRSSDAWEVVGHETVGEAAIHTTFWTWGLVPREDDEVVTNYTHPRSAGWAGDRLVAYANEDENGSADGYVWRTAWESEADARAFAEGYRRVLRVRLAARTVGDRYVVEDGPFADAFRVTREGETVTIVNAPTRRAVREVAGS